MLKDTQVSSEALKRCLDELTDTEYRVFFEYFVFKTRVKEIARIIGKSNQTTNNICKQLKLERDHLLPLREELLEAFLL